MRVYDGFEVVAEDENTVTQYRYYPPEGKKPGCNMTVVVPKHTDPAERDRALMKITEILLKGRAERLRREREAAKLTPPTT